MERGVAMVEFALILPVFLIIVAGLLAFGRIFFYWLEANHQANEAVRWAVVDRNPYAVPLQQHIHDEGTTEFANNVAVCIDFPEGDTLSTVAVGDAVRVRVQMPFDVIPLLGIGTVTIRGSATQRLERIANTTDPTAFDPADDIGTCT
jgi:Flp pilus assembly protein TadG